MNKLNFRNSKKGITPVIATIILIAATLVLALVVGAYTFGLFGANVKTITLSNGTIYGGTTGSFQFTLSNPSTSVTISSISVQGSWNSTSSAQSFWTFTPTSAGNGVTSVTAKPPTLGSGDGGAVSGDVYNYVISFANGQAISGSLQAQ